RRRLVADRSLKLRICYLEHPFRDFTRHSPLSFKRTISLIFGLLRKSTSIELYDLFTLCRSKPVTKSAFCQRRKLIKPIFFRDLFQLTVHQFYHSFKNFHTWRGLRLFAVDGTGQTLPREPWIGEAFGFHKNQHDQVPSTRLLITFDLLNKIIYRVDLHTQKSAEIVNAYPRVEQLPKEAIYIYDRGFAGYGLPFLHQRHGSYYVIRFKKEDSPVIMDFVQSGEYERTINIMLKDRAYRTLRDLGLEPVWKAELVVRLVRFNLPNDEVEVLMTNLMDRRRFHYKRIGQLYGWRWGVETAISNLKSFLQLALTSAYTLPGVEQDLWSTFCFYNINSAFEFATEQEVEAKTAHRKYIHQINRNMAAGLIKRWLPHLFISSERIWRAKTQVLKEMLLMHLEPYRPRPSRERKRRIIRAQDRHIYEPNYRSTM
ncbi:MAG: IS4 family transposase, partial [Bacteroidota bacterium]